MRFRFQTLLLSADGENDPDIMSILGASVALTVSDIPWAEPLGAVRVGRINGEFVANPTHSEREESDLDLIYVGNKTDVVMYAVALRRSQKRTLLRPCVSARRPASP